MTIRTRLLALVMALILTLGVAGCSGDTSYIATMGETKFTTGIYNNFLLEGFVRAYDLLPDQSQSPNVQMIGDIPGYRWIENYAKDAMTRYAATKSLFDKAGLSLSVEELAGLAESAQAQYDGNPTLFDGCGVTKEDMEEVLAESLWVQKLFEHYYGEGGPEAPSTEELRALYEKDYVRIVFMPVLKYDQSGVLFTDEAKLSELSALSQSYFERAISGVSIPELLVEETYRREQEAAAAAPAVPAADAASSAPAADAASSAPAADAASSTPAEAEEPMTLEERIEELEATLALDPYAYDQVFSREQTTLEASLLDAIYASTGAGPELFEGERYDFLYQRKALDLNPADFEAARSALTQTLKYDEFLKKFDDEEASLALTFNDATIKKYAAKKLNIAFSPSNAG